MLLLLLLFQPSPSFHFIEFMIIDYRLHFSSTIFFSEFIFVPLSREHQPQQRQKLWTKYQLKQWRCDSDLLVPMKRRYYTFASLFHSHQYYCWVEEKLKRQRETDANIYIHTHSGTYKETCRARWQLDAIENTYETWCTSTYVWFVRAHDRQLLCIQVIRCSTSSLDVPNRMLSNECIGLEKGSDVAMLCNCDKELFHLAEWKWFLFRINWNENIPQLINNNPNESSY